MKLAASRELFAYWNALRGARSAPERDDVDPGAIRGVLADTFILEFDPAAGFPLRVVGTRTNALFLRELRGSPFLDLWRQADRAEIAEIVVALADEAQPFLIGAAADATRSSLPARLGPLTRERLNRNRPLTASALRFASCATA